MFLPGTPAQAGEPFKPGCAGGLSTGRPARQRRGRAGGQYPRLHSRSPRQQQGMGPRAAGLPCWRSHRLLDPEGGGLPVAVRRPGGVQAAAPRGHRAAAASLLQAAAYGLRATLAGDQWAGGAAPNGGVFPEAPQGPEEILRSESPEHSGALLIFGADNC